MGNRELMDLGTKLGIPLPEDIVADEVRLKNKERRNGHAESRKVD